MDVVDRVLFRLESLDLLGRINGSGITRGGRILPYAATAFLQ